MPYDESLIQGFAEPGRIVAILKLKVSGARIVAAGGISWARQFKERLVLAQGQCMRVRCDVADK